MSNGSKIHWWAGTKFNKHRDRLMLTIINAKVCNAVKVPIPLCGATFSNNQQKDFNKLKADKVIDPDYLKFSLTLLHVRIRLLESILYLT